MTSPEPQDPQQQPEPSAEPGLTPLEEAFAALVLAALTVWLAAVAAKVMSPWRLWKMNPDPSGIGATVPMWIQKVDQLVSWLQRRVTPEGVQRWRDSWDASHDSRAPAIGVSTDSYIQAHLAAVKNFLVRIPDEVYQGVFAEISAGVNEGEGVMQIAERVDRMLQISGSENWPARARIISITEVNGASNAGWMAAAIQTQDKVGMALNKEWLASHDDHVRDTHRAADGQIRPLMEPFMVGGWPMMYPGDKAGPPEEVINCRCAATTTERPVR